MPDNCLCYCHDIIVEGVCDLSSLSAVICGSLFLPSDLSYFYQKLCLSLVLCSEEFLVAYPASVCHPIIFEKEENYFNFLYFPSSSQLLFSLLSNTSYDPRASLHCCSFDQ